MVVRNLEKWLEVNCDLCNMTSLKLQEHGEILLKDNDASFARAQAPRLNRHPTHTAFMIGP